MESFNWKELKESIKGFVFASSIFCAISIVTFIGVDTLRGTNRLEAIDLIYFLAASFLFSFAIAFNSFIKYLKQIYVEWKQKKNEKV